MLTYFAILVKELKSVMDDSTNTPLTKVHLKGAGLNIKFYVTPETSGQISNLKAGDLIRVDLAFRPNDYGASADTPEL